jgi:hypothetical protein
MTEIAQFLNNHYYSRYKAIIAPSVESLERAIEYHENRIVIVRKDEIKGIGIYFKLTSEGFEAIKSSHAFINEFGYLFGEHGDHVHFIIVAADSMKTIREGMRRVIAKERPKTISWFNPENTELHIRRF